MLLGRSLRRARRIADLTQEVLAARARVDRTYISDIENDKVSPTVDTLERLCAALGVRVSAVIADAEVQAPAEGDEAGQG